jgi:small-conductance mechanosensitive channel
MEQLLQNTATAIAEFFGNPLNRTVTILVIAFVVGVILRYAASTWLRNIAQRTETQYDDILVDALRRTILFIALLIGANIAVRELPPVIKTVLMPYLRPAINTGIIICMTYLVAQALRQVFKLRAINEESRIAAMSLTRRIVEFVVYTVGGVMILRTFGVDITAIVTALGVGGLAVALALQDTLSNAFAGMYITLARQIRKGDYIKTSDNFEGFVKDIGWRNTTIVTMEQNMVFIPNNKLAQAIVVNHFMPQEVMYARLTFGVHYKTDPDHVERVLKRLIADVGHEDYELANSHEQPPGKIRGVMTQPEPLVRLSAFGEYTLNFTLLFAVNTFDNQFEARHQLMKQLYYRFREEGIAIPMPMHIVYPGVDGFAAGNGLAVEPFVIPLVQSSLVTTAFRQQPPPPSSGANSSS